MVAEKLIDLFFSCLILVAMMYIFKIAPSISILYLPVFVLLLSILALGVSLWACALTVKYRDFRYALPFIIQVWFYGSPIIYSSSSIPDKWLALFALNPIVGIAEGFRWCIFGDLQRLGVTLPICISVTLAVFFTGLFYFYITQKNLTDII